MSFIRTITVNGRRYDQRVEKYRDGKKWKTRVLEHLGPSNRVRDVDAPKKMTTEEVWRQLSIEECRDFAGPAVAHAVAEELQIADAIDAEVSSGIAGGQVGKLVEAMVINRCLEPKSRNAMPGWYAKTVLPRLLDLPAACVTEDTLYDCMDLFDDDTVERIQRRLWKRLQELGACDDHIFYDLTSTYFEGVLVKMAKRGYSRDHRPDRLQVNIAIAVNDEGLPMSHRVLEGNVNDVTTVEEAVTQLADRFGAGGIFVFDRGMSSRSNRKFIDACVTSQGWFSRGDCAGGWPLVRRTGSCP